MTFQNRQGTNLNRRRLTIISQTPTEIIADIERADNATIEGTKIDASVFNTFQDSINSANSNATNALANSTSAISTANQASNDASNALSVANSASNTANSANTSASTANTNANSALTKANTNATNITNALGRIQALENSKPTFTLSGTTLNITTN